MKKSTLITLFTAAILFFGTCQVGWGQTVLYEDFNYTTPAYIGGNGNAGSTSNNWTTHSVTTGQTTTIDINDNSLSYTGLTSSSGNKVYLFSNANATSRDVNRSFTPLGTPSVMYYSALINVVDNVQIGTAFDYFLSFGGASGSSVTSLFGRLQIKSVNSGSNFRLGIQNNSGTGASQTEYLTDLNFGTTYLIVVKYDFNGASNDIASLWINPVSLGGSEPAGAITNSGSATQPLAFASICLRNSTTTPKVEIDEIRVGPAWADVTPTASLSAPTVQASAITFDNIIQTQMDVAWTNGDGAKRIVKINTSNSFTAPVNGTDPAANAVYGGSGEQVVYNGAGNTIPTVTGLTAGNTYWFKVFEYNGSGSGTLYCTASGSNNPMSQATSAGATAPLITSPTVTSITATSAVLGGNITADGGSPITERGTVWSTITPVTINDHKSSDGLIATGVFSHLRASLLSNTLIYYAAYATNIIGTTLTTESSFTTLLGEPTNHATGFTATAPNYSSITVSWADNDGTQPATGFLILANTTGTFVAPDDGVPATYDASLADGSGAVTVNHGTQTYTWYSLNSSTPYYFAIYPYTNSLTNIDYKTTPAAPTTNTTTQVYVAPVAAWTFDATAASPSTPTSVAANDGIQTGTAMLFADGTNGSVLWDQATELNAFAGTTINDPRQGASIIAGKSYCLIGGTGNSANGKSVVLKFSMTNYQDPILSFATQGTTTGFLSQQWSWSTDNISYTPIETITTIPASFATKTLDMSSINALDQATDVYLRVTFDGASSATGNNRLDNIVINASPAAPATKSLDVKVFLEGPYTGPGMSTLLNPTQIPIAQPYTGTPWSYSGSENVGSIPANVVDWVLVDLRDAATPALAIPSTRLAGWPKAFFLKSDGSIVDLDGSGQPNIGNPSVANNLYVVIRHRNHIAVMSATGMTLAGSTYSYDFSTDVSQAYNGSAGYKLIASGVYGMVTGDATADGNIYTSDYTQWSSKYNQAGYLNSDFTMDGNVYTSDYTKWSSNYNKGNPISKQIKGFTFSSQVPGDL